MGRVHWVGGEKGGVGKSVVARLLAQYCIDRAIPWSGFDTDRSHSALVRTYGGWVRAIDIDRMEDLDVIVDELEAGTEEVVVDLAAQTQAALGRWLEAGDVDALLERLGHEPWFWYVIDDGKASVQLLEALLGRLGNAGRVVCVLNHGRGGEFVLFEESKLRNRIEQRGGAVIDLPALHAGSMLKIDTYEKSFWGAIHNADPNAGPCLTPMERQRAKVFVRRAHAAFRALLDPQSEPGQL
ncbi:MAG: mobilization protein [Myxococcota bacterium]